MATLNQYQRYSQKENATTNNVLLMLSNLYEHSPELYEEYINGLLDESIFSTVPSFKQQVGKQKHGTVDGIIEQPAYTIIVETKLNSLENLDKLDKYSKIFDSSGLAILLHLSNKKFSDQEKESIDKKIKATSKNKEVSFASVSYEDLVDNLKALVDEHKYDNTLFKHYESFKEYCAESNLMPRTKHTLRAMACGQTFDTNVKNQIYFDFSERGYRHFKYLGIYKDKSVQYLGEVENVVLATYDIEKDILTIIENKKKVSAEEKKRIIDTIKHGEKKGWNVTTGHRFFLMGKMHKTDFRKTSPGGIFRVRYFEVDEEIGKEPKNAKEAAELLEGRAWKDDKNKN